MSRVVNAPAPPCYAVIAPAELREDVTRIAKVECVY